jgi:ferredoxin-NADP reductase
LHKDKKAEGNALYFSNKTAADIIEHQELLTILGVRATFLLSNDPKADGYRHGRIDEHFLKDQVSDFKQPFYICGPDEMVKDLSDLLKGMGASLESVIFEK